MANAGVDIFLVGRSALPRRGASIGNESNQVKEGYLVDALALGGDEGRGTLR